MADPLDAAKTFLEGFKLIYPDLFQQSISILGDDLSAVTEFLSLPFVRLKYASAEIKLRMADRFLKVVKELGLIDKTKRIAIPVFHWVSGLRSAFHRVGRRRKRALRSVA